MGQSGMDCSIPNYPRYIGITNCHRDCTPCHNTVCRAALLIKAAYLPCFCSSAEIQSEILLGVLVNFRIQATISSLLTLLFPDSDDSVKFFNHRLNAKINRLFNDAISGQENISQDASKSFHRKRIWRRYKK